MSARPSQSIWQRVNELELQVELQTASQARQKVRHFAAIAPVLRSLIRDRQEALVQAAYGSWSAAVHTSKRRKAIEDKEYAERVAREAFDKRLRNCSSAATTRLLQKWGNTDRKSLLRSVLSHWRMLSQANAKAKLAVYKLVWKGAFRVGPVGHCRLHTSMEASHVLFNAWRTCSANSRAAARADVARQHRRELRLQLCEVRNEIAALRIESNVTNATAQQLTKYAQRAAAVLGLILVDPLAAVDIPEEAMASDATSDVASNADPDMLDEAMLLEQAQKLLQLRGKVSHKLSTVRRSVATSLELPLEHEPSPPSEEAEVKSFHDVVDRIRRLRAERDHLSRELALARVPVESPLPSTRDPIPHANDPEITALRQSAAFAEEELLQERAKTAHLESRVAQAQDFVAKLRERHAKLLEEAAKPAAVAEVQRALSDLARVSEELLDVD